MADGLSTAIYPAPLPPYGTILMVFTFGKNTVISYKRTINKSFTNPIAFYKGILLWMT